jgi:hypothetical protein
VRRFGSEIIFPFIGAYNHLQLLKNYPEGRKGTLVGNNFDNLFMLCEK